MMGNNNEKFNEMKENLATECAKLEDQSLEAGNDKKSPIHFQAGKGDIKPVWQSSNHDRPNHRAALLDINDDGENELVAVEGSYTNPGKRKVTIWKWNGWGFSRLDIFDSNDVQL